MPGAAAARAKDRRSAGKGAGRASTMIVFVALTSPERRGQQARRTLAST